MYLAEVQARDIIKKQYQFKLKSYLGVFSSLIIIQCIAMLFSLSGTGSMSGGSSSGLTYYVSDYSGILIFIFMMIWGFITAIIITSKAYRYDDYSFVTNQMISHFSNILFLLSASVLGGLTVFLSTKLFHLVCIIIMPEKIIIYEQLTVLELVTGILCTVLYLILFTSIGYLVGMLVQLSRLFTFILPILFFGILILDGLHGRPSILPSIGKFFVNEASVIVFTFKIMVSSAIVYWAAILISKRVEVRP
jgi:hypothetical protein